MKNPEMISRRRSIGVPFIERDLNRLRLAEFLRRRRRRLDPKELGLPSNARRRSAGLRREDVAELAGISVAYYSWIEQARDLRLSRELIDAVAGALRLNEAEWNYVATLAGVACIETANEEAQQLHPTVAHVVGAHSSVCALLCDRWLNVLAASPLARKVLLVNATTWPKQNLIWRLCHDQDHASLWPDPVRELRLAVGMFRQSLAYDPHSIVGNQLLDELIVHPPFAEAWTDNEVHLIPSPAEYFREEPWDLQHRDLGRLRVHRLALPVPKPKQWSIVIFSPADTETEEKFAQIASYGKKNPRTRVHLPLSDRQPERQFQERSK